MAEEELDSGALRRRAGRGMRLMLSRQAFNLVVGLAGSIVLARALAPAEFGTYAIVVFLVSVLMLVGDLGLTASLIQRADRPTEHELQLSFTIQVLVVTAVVAATWIAVPFVLRLYPGLGPEAGWVARAFSLTLYVRTLRTVSTTQLERNLDYGPVARADMVEVLLFQGVAIAGALSGFGVWSFLVGAVAGSVAGSLFLFVASPWPIRLRISRREARGLIGYGVAFQAGGILNSIGGWATPLFVGTLVGPGSVGYLNLASSNARRPLLLVESVMRVSFPHFSRLQTNAELLRRTILGYLVGFLWLVSLWCALLWTVGGPLIEVVYSAKWNPAVTPLMLFAASVPFDVISWTMGFSYASANRNWVEVRIVALRSILMFGAAAALVPLVGYLGVPIAYLVSSVLTVPLLLYRFAPGFLTQFARSTVWIAISTLVACLGGRTVLDAALADLRPVYQLVVGVPLAVVLFLTASLVLAPASCRARALRRPATPFGRTASSEGSGGSA
jgi:O-antigen/teichoic acid export membrane protein